MSFTKVEVIEPTLPKKVSIKVYFDPAQENMGLEKYGMVLYEGVLHTEQLACLERNGVKRYVTGLNEFAPEIKLMEDPEAKAAKIKEIRTVVSQLEKELAANVVEIDDADFWNKIELLRPDNSQFWDKIDLSAGNNIVPLDPKKNPYDLIKLYAIEAGGFTMVAQSLEAARNMAKPPKFYLDKYEETITTKNVSRKLKNKALAELQTLYDKNSNKLFYVAKVIDPGSIQYKKSTPNDVLYEVMDDYINGKSFENNVDKASETFLDTARAGMEVLKLKAIIKDAAYIKEIFAKSDGKLYHAPTQTMLGANENELIEYFKNPMNDGVLNQVLDVIETEWNK